MDAACRLILRMTAAQYLSLERQPEYGTAIFPDLFFLERGIENQGSAMVFRKRATNGVLEQIVPEAPSENYTDH